MPFSPVRLNHAVLFVSDLERSVLFYTEVFGMEVIARDPERTLPSSDSPVPATTMISVYSLSALLADRNVVAPSGSITSRGNSTPSTNSPTPARPSSRLGPTPASRATALPRASTVPTPTATSSR